MKVALSTSSPDRKSDSILAKPLKSQAFATPDKVAELIQKVPFWKNIAIFLPRKKSTPSPPHFSLSGQVGAAIEEDLRRAIEKLKLYLVNPPTQMILFKPIR